MALGRLDRRALLAGLAAAGLAARDAAGQTQGAGSRIVAVVNNEAISSQDLADRVRLSILSSGLPDNAETQRRLAPQVLRGLIDERLQVQEARRLRLAASEAEIDRAFAAVRHGERRLERTVHRTVAHGQGLWRRVLHALRAREAPPADDVTLAHRVESVIFRNPAVPKGRFNVNAENGVVFLRGQLDTAEQIALVERETRRVPGVQDVRNLLHLPGTPAPRA